MMGCGPHYDAQLDGFSLKKLANAALAVTAVVYPPAAPVIAAGAAVKSATKKQKKVVEAPAAPISNNIFDAFGPQNRNLVMLGSAVGGTLLLVKLLKR